MTLFLLSKTMAIAVLFHQKNVKFVFSYIRPRRLRLFVSGCAVCAYLCPAALFVSACVRPRRLRLLPASGHAVCTCCLRPAAPFAPAACIRPRRLRLLPVSGRAICTYPCPATLPVCLSASGYAVCSRLRPAAPLKNFQLKRQNSEYKKQCQKNLTSKTKTIELMEIFQEGIEFFLVLYDKVRRLLPHNILRFKKTDERNQMRADHFFTHLK